MKIHSLPIRQWLWCVAALSAVVLPARADDAAQIVKNVRSALGVDAFEKQDKAVRLEGPQEILGLKGAYTLTFDAAGCFHRSSDALVPLESIFDGETVRARDLGGEVTEQLLGDRTEALFNIWAVTGLWFSKDRCKDFVLDEKAGTDKIAVLQIALDDGRVRASVKIDRQTWRPTGWTFHGPIGNSTFEFSGQTRAGPLLVPTDIRIESENGSRISTGTTKADLVPVPQWSAELTALKPPNDTSFDGDIPPELEVKKVQTGHLLVHPLVNGKDLGWFIFDTGAGQNVFDQRVIKDADLKTFGAVPAVGVGGATKASLCRPKTLQLGPMTLREPLAVVMDLAFLDPFMGVKIAGIVGYGTFARCLVDFDLAKAKISIHDPAKYELSGANWTRLLIYDRVPCVPGRFEDHDGTFRLDTGAAGTLSFHAPTVERLKLLEGRKNSMSMVGGVGGMKKARSGKIKSLEFGGKKHKKMEATFATEAAGAFADPYIDANIGGDVIGKSVMVIDYPHSRIAFKWKPKKIKAATHTGGPDEASSAKASSKKHSTHRAQAHSTPMEMVNDRPVIEIRVQGKGPYRFVFDTGAGITVLTPELARELKLESTGKTQIGDPSAPNAIEVDSVNVDFELCGEKFSDVSAVVWDDNAIFSALGDVRGIVGMTTLVDRVVTLDFAEKQFRLSKRPLSETGTVPCENHHGMPMMELSIGGQTVPVHLDTGKTRDLSIPAKLRNKLKFKHPPVSAQARSANGEFDMEIATLDGSAEIAGYKIADPELELTDRFRQAVMGTGILRRFVIDIDLAGERARFTPIKGWKLPASEKRRYGIMMSMGNGPVAITGVIPGSVAERAGLQKDDVILKANGKDFEALNFSERGQIVRRSPLALTIERDGKQIEIKLVFDDQPNPSEDESVEKN